VCYLRLLFLRMRQLWVGLAVTWHALVITAAAALHSRICSHVLKQHNPLAVTHLYPCRCGYDEAGTAFTLMLVLLSVETANAPCNM
jgi:hypothetical protein